MIDPLQPVRNDLARMKSIADRFPPIIKGLEREVRQGQSTQLDYLVGFVGVAKAELEQAKQDLVKYRLLFVNIDQTTRDELKRLTIDLENQYNRLQSQIDRIARLRK